MDIIKEYNDIVVTNFIQLAKSTFTVTAIWLIIKTENDYVTISGIKSTFESEYKKLIKKFNKLAELVPSINTDDVKQLIKDLKNDSIDLVVENVKGEII